MHERDQTDKSIKREKLKGDLKEKQKQMADVMETINKTEKDKNDLETQVKETQQTIQKVKNVESAVSKGQWLAGGIAAVSGIVVQFSQKYDTSLLDVIDCAADSHDAMDKSLERLFATLRSLNSRMEACELAIDTSHVASFEATSLPEVVQPENQDTINDVLNKLENL
uniref:Uncharacterized protein n=1 Tax=Panagrolaimus davidi TaxID=227884 RepID=A0A914R454_9BILA